MSGPKASGKILWRASSSVPATSTVTSLGGHRRAHVSLRSWSSRRAIRMRHRRLQARIFVWRSIRGRPPGSTTRRGVQLITCGEDATTMLVDVGINSWRYNRLRFQTMSPSHTRVTWPNWRNCHGQRDNSDRWWPTASIGSVIRHGFQPGWPVLALLDIALCGARPSHMRNIITLEYFERIPASGLSCVKSSVRFLEEL